MEITIENLGENLRETVESIVASFESKDDDFVPVFAFAPEQGENVILAIDPQYFESDERKDMLVDDVIVPAANNLGAKVIGSVMSAWISEVPRDHKGEIPRPSQDPNRMEAVFITVMDSLSIASWKASILRRPDGPPTLGDWEQLPKGILSGRFVEPIQDALRDSSGRMDKDFLEFLRKRTIDLTKDDE